jgi:carboxypeptidase family protein
MVKGSALIALAVLAPAIHAQTTFTGRVLSDSGAPLVGAEVVIAKLQKIQRTDTNGEFRITGLPAGDHIVGIRMLGYAPHGDTIEVADAGEVQREYRLKPIATKLPEVPVTAKSVLDRKLIEFYERRQYGVGRFLDSAEFANARGTKTSDRLAKMPGILIQRGRGNEVFVSNTRQRLPGEPGSRSFCRSLVWLDGVNLGVDYNVNELDPSMIAAVEWYASNQNAPAKLVAPPRPSAASMSGRPEPYCGILVIWLR